MYIQVLRPVYIRILRIRIVAELKLLCKDGKPSEQMSTAHCLSRAQLLMDIQTRQENLSVSYTSLFNKLL